MKQKRFTAEELSQLRNGISVRSLLKELKLEPKASEGQTRFLCPSCNEYQTAVHPRENLGRCFRCGRNYNPIELVMAARGIDFVSSVNFLKNYSQAALSIGR
jgi:DNA primase